MTHRFYKKRSSARNLLISAALFAAVILLFQTAVSSLSTRTEAEELQTLQAAVTRGITYCYATEGTYPPSLAYLKEHYGLTYNEDKYFVDYQPMGTNIMPDVTIIRRRADKEGSQ